MSDDDEAGPRGRQREHDGRLGFVSEFWLLREGSADAYSLAGREVSVQYLWQWSW